MSGMVYDFDSWQDYFTLVPFFSFFLTTCIPSSPPHLTSKLDFIPPINPYKRNQMYVSHLLKDFSDFLFNQKSWLFKLAAWVLPVYNGVSGDFRSWTVGSCPHSSLHTLSHAISLSAAIWFRPFEALAVLYLLIWMLFFQENFPGDPDPFDVSVLSTLIVHLYPHCTHIIC